MPLTTITNDWMPVALLLTGRIFLLGFAWCWLLPSARDRMGRWLVHAVQPIVIGLPLLLVLRMTSGDVARLPALAPEALAIVGIVAGLLFRRKKLIARIKPVAAGFLLASLGSNVIMHLPERGEWIVGGWDPGIYINEGVSLARLDSYKQDPDPFFSQLSPGELKLFTRERLDYLEAHPVVILNPESRAIERFFFPLTSTVIAEYAQAGGIRAATRVNYFLGLFAALTFAGMLATFKLRPPIVVFASLCLVLQPVWLYHLNIPTSEMLQLFFVASLGLLLPHLHSHLPALFGFGLIMLCAGLNRFGFLPFGALLCSILALHDLGKIDPRRAWRVRLVQLIPLWMAAGHCAFHNATTLDRLGDLTPTIFLAGGIFSLAALFIDLVAPRIGNGTLFTTLYRKRLVLPAMTLALVAYVFIMQMDRSNIGMIAQGILNYLSAPILVLAGIGLLMYFVGNFEIDEALFALVTFLACATVLVLLQSEIAPLMPWASRRLMMYTVPLAALLCGLGFAPLRSNRQIAGIALVLLLAIAGINRAKLWQAANTREYIGVSVPLQAVADQIGPNDIVVADHFLWSTPLRMLHGKNVINGEVLWTEDRSDAHHLPATERYTKAMQVLRRFQSEGKTIRFLASTPKLLEFYPAAPDVNKDWQGDAFDYALLNHHKQAAGFDYKPRSKQFTLFTLKQP